jgi:hypothetical protein
MLQVFYLNVAYVAMVIHICCSDYTHMLQAYVSNVSVASDVCCRKWFHGASVSWAGAGSPRRRMSSLCVQYECCKSRSRCRICYNCYTHMLQISIHNVSSTLDICCKCFYLDIAYIIVAIHIRYKHMFQIFHLLRTYIIESAFTLFRVFHFHTSPIVGYCNVSWAIKPTK